MGGLRHRTQCRHPCRYTFASHHPFQLFPCHRSIQHSEASTLSDLWTINDYNKHILDDKNSLVIADKAPFHVKAAGYANYLLNRPENKKYRTKYNTIKPGDKVRVYQTSNPNYPYFAFTPLNFPVEYAPAMNYDEIFNINILSRINSILTILGYKELTSTLCYSSPLF